MEARSGTAASELVARSRRELVGTADAVCTQNCGQVAAALCDAYGVPEPTAISDEIPTKVSFVESEVRRT
jgi:hypothetical protein